jgi:hypothetical protein
VLGIDDIMHAHSGGRIREAATGAKSPIWPSSHGGFRSRSLQWLIARAVRKVASKAEGRRVVKEGGRVAAVVGRVVKAGVKREDKAVPVVGRVVAGAVKAPVEARRVGQGGSGKREGGSGGGQKGG